MILVYGISVSIIVIIPASTFAFAQFFHLGIIYTFNTIRVFDNYREKYFKKTTYRLVYRTVTRFEWNFVPPIHFSRSMARGPVNFGYFSQFPRSFVAESDVEYVSRGRPRPIRVRFLTASESPTHTHPQNGWRNF